MAEVTLHVEVTGGPSLQAAIESAFANLRPELEGTLTEEGEEIIAVSKEVVPVDSGDLRSSGGLYGSEDNAEGVFVRIGYGGIASSYALLQHETPPHIFSHSEGRSWKYLEQPFYEAVTTMGPRLAGRLAARLATRFGVGGGANGGGETFGSD